MQKSSLKFYYKQNRLQQLRGFYYAAMYGSISSAAHEMGLTQPTVTLQIQSLERDLEVKLFEKQGNRLKLSEEGRLLFELAANHVEGLDNIRNTFQQAKKKLSNGVLRIGVGFISSSYFMPKYLQKFTAEYPDVKVVLRSVGSENEHFDMLRDGKVDMLCGSFNEVPDYFQYIPVLDSEPVLITALDHPLAKKKGSVMLEDIVKHDILMPPAYAMPFPVVTAMYDDYRKINKVDRKLDLELPGWGVIKKYVALGMGISIISKIALEPGDRLAAISLKKHLPHRSYGAMLRRSHGITEEMNGLLGVLMSSVDTPQL